MARIRTIKRKSTIPSSVRREIALRHGCKPGESVDVKCAYCDFVGGIYWYAVRRQKLGWVAFSGLEMDHITPEAEGGKTTTENLVLCCRRCNRSKGSKTEWRPAHG